MADNLTLNAGSGGSVIRAQDVTSVFYPVGLVAWGVDGGPYVEVDDASGSGLPVQPDAGAVFPVSDNAGSLTVDAPVGTPVFVRLSDGSAAITTLPVSLASVPSHAVTNAGTFAVQVDGAALTSLQLIDNLVLAEDAAHQTADPGVQLLAVRKATPADLSGTDGDYEPLQVNGGRLWVDASGVTLTVGSHAVTNAGTFAVQAAQSGTWNVTNVSGTVSLPTGAATAAKQPALGTAGTASSDVITIQGIASMTAIQVADNGASLTVDNGGTFAVQVDGGALTALQLIDDPVFADDAAFTIGTSKVMVAGGVVDDASTDAADEGDAAALRVTTSRQLIVNPQPHTTGGLSVFRTLDLDETEEEVKATAGCLYKLRVTNRTATVRYVKLYNATAANTTVGTTTPLDTIPIPANASDYTVLTESFGGLGLTFDTALSIAATTGFADNDVGAPGANDLIVSVYYK